MKEKYQITLDTILYKCM
jgi:tRNA G18 (ribose-2'-O)-methylase SpoU